MESSESGSLIVVVEAKIKNHDKFYEYLRGILPTITQYDGKITSAVEVEKREIMENGGMWQMMAIMEWPSAERYYQWYNSNEYKPYRSIRQFGAEIDVTFCKKIL